MIRVNEFIINENLIKAAVPHLEPLKNGVQGFPPPSTKILFTDGTETVFFGLDVQSLFIELDRVKNNS